MFSRAVACALRRGVVAEFDEEHRALRIRGALVGAIINRPPVISTARRGLRPTQGVWRY